MNRGGDNSFDPERNMVCPSCGKILGIHAEKCPACGETFSSLRKSRVTFQFIGFFFGMVGLHFIYAGHLGKGISRMALTAIALFLLVGSPLMLFSENPAMFFFCIGLGGVLLLLIFASTVYEILFTTKDARGIPFDM